jgi:hypothetical protein
MLLFSERTWKHHCVTLLLPFSVLVYYLACCNPGPRMKKYVIITLAAAALCMAATSTGWSSSLERIGKLTQVYGAYVWANLALTVALVVVLRQQRVALRLAAPAGQTNKILRVDRPQPATGAKQPCHLTQQARNQLAQ